MVNEHTSQAYLWLCVEQIRRMQQALRLLLDRESHFGMAMPKRVNSDTREKIEVFPAFHVIDASAVPTGNSDRVPGIGVHQVLAGALYQFFGQHGCAWS